MVRLRIFVEGHPADDRCWEPDLAPLRICFPRSEPTVFTVGVCGTMLTRPFLKSRSRWESGCSHGCDCRVAVAVYLPRSASIRERSAARWCDHRASRVLSYLHSMIDFSLQIPGYLSYSVFCSVAARQGIRGTAASAQAIVRACVSLQSRRR